MSLQRNTQEENIQIQPVDQKLLNRPDGTGAGVYSNESPSQAMSVTQLRERVNSNSTPY